MSNNILLNKLWRIRFSIIITKIYS